MVLNLYARILLALATSFCAIIEEPVYADGIPPIPSLDAISTPPSGQSVVAPPPPYSLAATSAEYETDPTDPYEMAKGYFLDKYLYDPAKGLAYTGLKNAYRGLYSARAAAIGSTVETGAFDLSLDFASGSLDAAGLVGYIPKIFSTALWADPIIKCVQIILIATTSCSDTETPEMDDVNSVYNSILMGLQNSPYSGMQYGPIGQYQSENPPIPPPQLIDPTQPGCDEACWDACYNNMLCYCTYIDPSDEDYCCQLDDSCDPCEYIDCGGASATTRVTRLKRVGRMKRTPFSKVQKSGLPH